MKAKLTLFAAVFGFTTAAFAATPNDGFVLPFPPTPAASKAGPTLQESVHKRRVEPDLPHVRQPRISARLLPCRSMPDCPTWAQQQKPAGPEKLLELVHESWPKLGNWA